MTEREVRKILTENGFKEGRRARHGTFWSDSISMIMVGNLAGRGDASYKTNKILDDIKKAVKKRSHTLTEALPIPAPKTQIESAFRRYEAAAPSTEITENEGEEEMPGPQQVIRRPVAPDPTPELNDDRPQVPELFLHILTDPHLTDSKKVKMLTAYLED